MDTVKIPFYHLSKLEHVEFSEPTNQEHNSYWEKRNKIESDQDLIIFRTIEFEKRYVSSTIAKEKMYDREKSLSIFQLYEMFFVEAKN